MEITTFPIRHNLRGKKINREYYNVKEYMFTPARINFAQPWKKHTFSIINWELKLGKYTAVAKITVHLHNRSVTKFKQERIPYKNPSF